MQIAACRLIRRSVVVGIYENECEDERPESTVGRLKQADWIGVLRAEMRVLEGQKEAPSRGLLDRYLRPKKMIVTNSISPKR